MLNCAAAARATLPLLLAGRGSPPRDSTVMVGVREPRRYGEVGGVSAAAVATTTTNVVKIVAIVAFAIARGLVVVAFFVVLVVVVYVVQ